MKPLNRMNISEFMFDVDLQAKRETKFTQEHEFELKKWAKAIMKETEEVLLEDYAKLREAKREELYWRRDFLKRYFNINREESI